MYKSMPFLLVVILLIFSRGALAADVATDPIVSWVQDFIGYTSPVISVLLFVNSLFLFMVGRTELGIIVGFFAFFSFKIPQMLDAIFVAQDNTVPNAGIENTKDALPTGVVGLEGANEPSLAGAFLLAVGVGIGILVAIWAYNHFYRRDLDRESMELFERIRGENDSTADPVAAVDVPLDSEIAELPHVVDSGGSGQKPLPGKRRVNLD